MAEQYEKVQFRTLDGIFLRGRLYPAAQRGPAVILSPGYNVTLTNFPPGVATTLQKAGITALVYDPRNTGTSGGFPRNDINPFAQVEDYSDAFCYMTTLDIVDPKAIFFWGISLSAGIALSAAAVDRRIAGVIGVAPIFKFLPVKEGDSKRLKRQMVRDREAQVLRGEEGYVLPIMESLAEIPFNSHVNAQHQGHPNGGGMADDQTDGTGNGDVEHPTTDNDTDPSEHGLTHNPNGTTLQSYHRMFLFEPVPEAMAAQIHPTPVMFLTPSDDQISPPEKQTAVFESLRAPKRQVFAPGKEHVYVLHGPEMPTLVRWQVEFVWEVVRGGFSSKQ
ncbi:Alpha/Beta hydrolase protein [Aspergillus carlsbadensis]|nr:Alpha/Beta hydrolase protein [Aspergillus carlsbadensis]